MSESVPADPAPARRPTRWQRALQILALALIAGAALDGGYDLWSARLATFRNDASSYAFLRMQPDGSGPVTYSSCRPIDIVVNSRTMPREAEGLVEEAVAEVAAASGLDLQLIGDATTPPGGRIQVWAPVLIAWSDVAEEPRLEGNAGLGGSVTRRAGVNGAIEVYVTGQATLNGPVLDDYLDRRNGREQARGVIIHELAHVLGLDHVDDPGQLMHDGNSAVDELRAGDRAGLAHLGQGPCIREL